MEIKQYWECNNCKVMYLLDSRPHICPCGNDMMSNSTKRKVVVIEDMRDEIEKIRNQLPLMEDDGVIPLGKTRAKLYELILKLYPKIN